ncbi:MAG TPA: hypothetical protein P5568_09215, partial [Acidobacteriota bacterium]|nr:hypothetical protein [Acidobacteriota bacterium]
MEPAILGKLAEAEATVDVVAEDRRLAVSPPLDQLKQATDNQTVSTRPGPSFARGRSIRTRPRCGRRLRERRRPACDYGDRKGAQASSPATRGRRFP